SASSPSARRKACSKLSSGGSGIYVTVCWSLPIRGSPRCGGIFQINRLALGGLGRGLLGFSFCFRFSFGLACCGLGRGLAFALLELRDRDRLARSKALRCPQRVVRG